MSDTGNEPQDESQMAAASDPPDAIDESAEAVVTSAGDTADVHDPSDARDAADHYESDAVVQAAQVVIGNEQAAIARIVDRLDDSLIAALVEIGRQIAEIGKGQGALESKLEDLVRLVQQHEHNREVLEAAVERVPDSMNELRMAVKSAVPAAGSIEKLDLTSDQAGRWTAGLVLYLAGAALTAAGLTALHDSGKEQLAAVFTMVVGMVFLHDHA